MATTSISVSSLSKSDAEGLFQFPLSIRSPPAQMQPLWPRMNIWLLIRHRTGEGGGCSNGEDFKACTGLQILQNWPSLKNGFFAQKCETYDQDWCCSPRIMQGLEMERCNNSREQKQRQMQVNVAPSSSSPSPSPSWSSKYPLLHSQLLLGMFLLGLVDIALTRWWPPPSSGWIASSIKGSLRGPGPADPPPHPPNTLTPKIVNQNQHQVEHNQEIKD